MELTFSVYKSRLMCWHLGIHSLSSHVVKRSHLKLMMTLLGFVAASFSLTPEVGTLD